MDRCEGEARVSSRKGKVINNTKILFNKDLGKVSSVLIIVHPENQVLFMYDWSLVVAWEGTPCKGSALQGKLEV